MTEHRNIFVFGDVQGVFFRRTVKHEASRQGLAGFVQNKPDGSVYIEAEGLGEAIAAFTAWLEAGADGHAVKRVDAEPGAFKAFSEFVIKE